MRYDKPVYPDPPVWGPPPRESTSLKEGEGQYEARLMRLSRINAVHLRNAISRNDDAALEVASHIGRYISDITIVDLIRASIRGDRYTLHELVKKMMEESILIIAGQKAERQIERYSA